MNFFDDLVKNTGDLVKNTEDLVKNTGDAVGGWVDKELLGMKQGESTPVPHQETLSESWFRYCKNGELEKAKELLGHDSTLLQATDAERNTALHFAARGGQLHVVKFLKQECQAESLQNKNGQYPRHLANQLKRRHEGCAKVALFLDALAKEEGDGGQDNDLDEEDDQFDPEEPRQYHFHHVHGVGHTFAKAQMRVVALYEFPRDRDVDELPFSDDSNPELRVIMDDKLVVKEIKDDFVLCTNKQGRTGWVAANVLSSDGRTPFLSQPEQVDGNSSKHNIGRRHSRTSSHASHASHGHQKKEISIGFFTVKI